MINTSGMVLTLSIVGGALVTLTFLFILCAIAINTKDAEARPIKMLLYFFLGGPIPLIVYLAKTNKNARETGLITKSRVYSKEATYEQKLAEIDGKLRMKMITEDGYESMKEFIIKEEEAKKQ